MKKLISFLLIFVMLLSTLAACGFSHTHDFSKAVQSSEYLKETGCPEKKAIYYYSCECGEKGSESFEGAYGQTHDFSGQVTTAPYFAEDASAESPAKYYYCCTVCGAKSTELFSHGKPDSARAAAGSKAKEALDGKKILIVGCSYNFYGKIVMPVDDYVTDLSARQNDMGYFYELCKQNGADVSVTNWCFGGHDLSDLLGDSCMADRACGNDFDHLGELTDLDYDYVSLMDIGRSTLSLEECLAELQGFMKMFTDVNPDCKFIYSIPCGAYWYKDKDRPDFQKLYVSTVYAKEIAKLDNMVVMDWGRLIYDLIKGYTTVPDSQFTYDANSFIVGDGYHPNLLTGYINSLMTYCLITGETAVGQPTNLENGQETSMSMRYKKSDFVMNFYTGYAKKTNFVEIMDSREEMEGIQKLIDRYIDMQTYLYY